MRFRISTIEKLGETFIRFGEASVIGGAATLFVQDFSVVVSLGGIFGGTMFIWVGLLIFDGGRSMGKKITRNTIQGDCLMKTPDQIAMWYAIAMGIVFVFVVGSALFVVWSSKKGKKTS